MQYVINCYLDKYYKYMSLRLETCSTVHIKSLYIAFTIVWLRFFFGCENDISRCSTVNNILRNQNDIHVSIAGCIVFNINVCFNINIWFSFGILLYRTSEIVNWFQNLWGCSKTDLSCCASPCFNHINSSWFTMKDTCCG